VKESISSSPLLSGSIIETQIELEIDAVESGVARYRRLAQEAVDRGEGAGLKPAERLTLHWYEPLLLAIQQEQQEIADGKQEIGRQSNGGVILRMSAEKLAFITMHETVSACMKSPQGIGINEIAHTIGRSVVTEMAVEMTKSVNEDAHYVITQWMADQGTSRIIRYLKKNVENLDPAIWSRKLYIDIGVRLLFLLIETASCDAYDKPFKAAFEPLRTMRKTRRKLIVRMNRDAALLIEEGHRARQSMRPRYLPMIVQPYPWVPEAQGGYVKVRTPLISKPTPDQKKAIKRADMSRIYDGINAISSTPWSIDPFILDIMNRIFDSGGGKIGIPRLNNWPVDPMPDGIYGDPELVKKWKRERHELHTTNMRLMSDRSEFMLKIHTAKRMMEFSEIYFPHQLDFRSRCYPIPLYLNHQGDDICRGLLRFAEKKPVKDMRQIRIHAAGVFGHDKQSFEYRDEWTLSVMDELRRCAEDPIGNTFWMTADKPWQFLAACKALFDKETASMLPVQTDGTCNGLQHYTAMGRDAAGAEVVNMTPSDRPSDIYSIVAERVAASIREDDSEVARRIIDFVSRSTVKQPVMTNVYGVTMVGAREQTASALKKANFPDEKERLYEASAYLSQKTMSSIGEVCYGAAEIMKWLKQTASKIVKKSKSVVEWTTPLGMPVVQPYRRWATVQVRTCLGRLTTMVQTDRVPVHAGKQMSGIAPNFVHSIDATHMLMTAIECRSRGITFAGVHDSYWTHANQSQELGQILREKFVELHRHNLLIRVASEWRERYPNVEIDDPPEPGTYDINSVLTAPYFFN